MVFQVSLDDAQARFPEFEFVQALTPSAQKAAFHVRDGSGRDLCLKIISPTQNLERVGREISALKKLDHPNIARLVQYTFSTKDSETEHYMIEEFVPGSDLSIDDPWSLDAIVSFFSQLLDGLALLKENELVHRDLKPSNIRIKDGSTPVIIDFGLVRCLDQEDLTRTATGAGIGTPLYFSPEQFEGTRHDIEHRTDLFAVGILMYKTAVGRHPFAESNMTLDQLKNAVLNSTEYLEYEGFKSLEPKLKLLISKLLRKERAQRPYSAEEAKKILESCITE